MTSRPRIRLTTDARRDQLLNIGVELFASYSYSQVSIEEVARRAEVSRGLMYHYFPSKRAFLAAIVEATTRQMLQATQPDPTLAPKDQLRAGLDAYLDFAERYESGYRAIHRGSLSADEQIQDILDHGIRQQEDRILGALTTQPPAPPALRLAVHGWLAFVNSACLHWLDQERPVQRTQLRDLCAQTLITAISTAGHA